MTLSSAYHLLFCLLAVAANSFLLPAKSQSSFRISTALGLQTNAITDITRDRNNNMWIGTYNGLYKHEGANIKAFVNTGKGPADLSGLEMHSVYEDKLGFIWTATTNGLDKINPHTYEIKHYPIRSKDSSSSFVGYLTTVFQDDEDYIWIGTNAALFRMNYQTGEYVAIPVVKDHTGMPNCSVDYNCGIKTGKGIWIHTIDGMVYYEYATKKFYHRYHNPTNNPVFVLNGPEKRNRSQSAMEPDDKGNIWFVAETGLLACYNRQTNKLDTFRFQHPANAWHCCYSVKADGRGNIWLAFRHGGLLLFDVRAKTFRPILYKERNSLISSNYVYSLERDYAGNIWVATDNGIDVIDYYNHAVQQRQLSTQPDFTNLQYITGDFSYDGDKALYIPFSRFGFLKYNIATDAVEAFGAGKEEKSRGTSYVIPENENFVWAARDKKLVKINLVKKMSAEENYSSVLPTEIEKFSGDVIWFWEQNPSSVYIRKSSGVFLHVKKDTVDVMRAYAFKKNTTLARNGQSIWYLTEKLNLVKKSVTAERSDTIWLQEKLKKTDFSFSNPRDMTDDGESIWMTGQNGLLRYSYKTGTLKTYSTKEGLSHSSTYSLITDDMQRVWAGSIGGIDVYDKNSGLFKPVISFPVSTYMDAFGSALRINKDTLVFHAGNKLFIINPAAYFNSQGQDYVLHFQEVQVNGNSIDINDAKKLAGLKYYHNKLFIRFGLLRFDQQQNINYWYRLKENDDWVLHGKKTELILNELQSGNYTLSIKATDASGNLAASEKSISFRIAPPWWKTWWFRLLIIAAISFIVYSFFRNREKNIRAKAALQLQLTELESKALRAQMNPHFIFNSLNAIQELIVTKKVDEGYQYLSNFSKLLRYVLNNSEKNLIPLSAEIETIKLQLSLESLRFKNTFNYSFAVDEGVEQELVNIPPLLLQPYVENAVWHGLRHKEGDKNLWIRIKETAQQLDIEIEDNGIGREAAEKIKKQKLGAGQFESKGSALSAQRIKMLAGRYPGTAAVTINDVKNENGESTGTIVRIILPSNLSQHA